jgi:hypothetical protein
MTRRSLLLVAAGAPRIVRPETGAAELVVDAGAVREPMEIGRHALGQGGLSDEPMFDGAAVRALRPHLIRLFVQEYFDVYPRRGVYNWRTLDRSVDNILASGARPLMSLCIKPRALYPVIDQNRVDPTSYAEWEELIYRMVAHYKNEKKSGIRYWEVFNEPDIGEDGGCPSRFTPETYNRYYTHTVRAIRRADPAARVGGPALASHRSPLLPALLRHCSENAVPLDFVSWHIYSSDPRAIADTVVAVRKLLAQFPALKCETMLDEWNMSLSRPRLEPGYQPAFLLESIRRMREAGLDYSCYYHIRDWHVSEEQFAQFMSPGGTLNMVNWWNLTPQFDGLYDFQGVMRPAWFAFRMLSRLTGRRLEVSSGEIQGLAAWDEEQRMLHALVWNFAVQPPPARNTRLVFRNLPGRRWALRRFTLDAATASNQENDRLCLERNDTLDGSAVEDSFELPPYGVGLVALRAVK